MKVVLISCVKKKSPTKCSAKDMYQSNWFKSAWNYAQNQNPDKILILSAKHGVLEENTVIEPYDCTLKNMTGKEKKDWAKQVLDQLSAKTKLKTDEFIILAGKEYRQGLLVPGGIKNYNIPMEGKRYGEQVKILKEALK